MHLLLAAGTVALPAGCAATLPTACTPAAVAGASVPLHLHLLSSQPLGTRRSSYIEATRTPIVRAFLPVSKESLPEGLAKSQIFSHCLLKASIKVAREREPWEGGLEREDGEIFGSNNRRARHAPLYRRHGHLYIPSCHEQC